MVKSRSGHWLVVIILTLGRALGHESHGSLQVASFANVLQLSDANFAFQLADVDMALVKFFTPNCGYCQQLAPEFQKAADVLNEDGSDAKLAEVDCSGDGQRTCNEYRIEGYPTMKVFERGQFSFDYDGSRESSAIVEFMKRKVGPISTELKTFSDVDRFFKYTELIIVGFFEDESLEIVKEFLKLTEIFRRRIRFGHSFNADICANYSYKNEIVLFREPRFQTKFEPSQIAFKGKEGVTVEELKEWVLNNTYSLVGHRTMRNAEEFKRPLVVIYFEVDYLKNTKGTNYWRNRITKVAKRFADEGRNVSFAMSHSEEFKTELMTFGLKTDRLPVVAARNLANQKFRMTEEFSVEEFEKFVESFLGGNLKPYIKTEPIPETNDGPVKIVVAENFDEIVRDESKDVLLALYSPMCGHCMVLEPKLEKLAKKLKDETDVIIAKMDGTANEIPEEYSVFGGYPTIYFAPKRTKDKPSLYQGEREEKDFLKYLAREATEPLRGFDRKGKPLKTAEGKKPGVSEEL